MMFAERCVHFEWVPCEAGERNVGEIMGGGNFESGVGGAGATCRTGESERVL